MQFTRFEVREIKWVNEVITSTTGLIILLSGLSCTQRRVTAVDEPFSKGCI